MAVQCPGPLIAERNRQRVEPLAAGRRQTVIGELDQAVVVRRDYVLFVVLSCVIATFGLVLNSGAVIIGAMLIAPLMPPILAFALAVVPGDVRRAAVACATVLLGAGIAVGLSAALGLLVAGSEWNSLAQLPTEILSRTQPSLFDLAVALAGGAAAAYALAEPKLSATLAGVAVATALMPPLCVVGLGLAGMDASVWRGALLLFCANFVAITCAGALVFALRGFSPTAVTGRRLVLGRTLLVSGPLLLAVALPLTFFTAHIITGAHQDAIIRGELTGALAAVGGGTLVNFDQRRQADHLLITATVRATTGVPFPAAKRMEADLAAQLDEPVALTLLVIPMTRLDPALPPTATPRAARPTPAGGVLAGATAPPTALPTVPPTPTAAATAIPSPTATPTAAPTATPTALPTAPPTALPTATPVAYAVVGGTDQQGVNVRRAPGPAPVLTALADGSVVELTGRTAPSAGYDWTEVIAPDGTVGWVAGRYLAPHRRYVAP
jgi:uncharacterized hydrophobic protein (TIGR00271 family)